MDGDIKKIFLGAFFGGITGQLIIRLLPPMTQIIICAVLLVIIIIILWLTR